MYSLVRSLWASLNASLPPETIETIVFAEKKKVTLQKNISTIFICDVLYVRKLYLLNTLTSVFTLFFALRVGGMPVCRLSYTKRLTVSCI